METLRARLDCCSTTRFECALSCPYSGMREVKKHIFQQLVCLLNTFAFHARPCTPVKVVRGRKALLIYESALASGKLPYYDAFNRPVIKWSCEQYFAFVELRMFFAVHLILGAKQLDN